MRQNAAQKKEKCFWKMKWPINIFSKNTKKAGQPNPPDTIQMFVTEASFNQLNYLKNETCFQRFAIPKKLEIRPYFYFISVKMKSITSKRFRLGCDFRVSPFYINLSSEKSK